MTRFFKVRGSGFRVQGSGLWWRLRRDPSTQVAAVLAFVISHTTFLAAQDDETGRCPKVCEWQVSLVSPAFPAWGRQREGGFAAKKGSQPRLAALGSPFQGKGLAWTLPPSYGRRCPEGAEVGWGKRDEKERGKSSQAGDIRKYPNAAGAVPLPQWGRLRYENTASPP